MFDSNQEMYFVLETADGSDPHVVGWPDFTRDWTDAGWKVADWFYARTLESAAIKAGARRYPPSLPPSLPPSYPRTKEPHG